MKHWISKNYKTLIIAAFLIPIMTVAIVSISHVTQWYGISNPVSWAVYLSIGIEIAALSALAAISANMGKKVYFPFAIVTLVQFIGNIFFAYSFIDVDSKQFKDWVDLVSPFVEFMGVDPTDFVGHKRFLAFFAGGMLPIISLSFLHMLVKFTEEDRMRETNNNVEEKIIEKVDAKDIIAEVSKIRLSEEDLAILEKHLSNPTPPNEKLKEAAKRYSDEVREKHTHIDDFVTQPTQEERHEILTEMMKNDQELGLYDEPFDNPMVKEVVPALSDEEVNEMVLNEWERKEDDDISDWDVTLMDGLEEEENNFQEEPTEEEIQQNFSTITSETENIFQNNEEPVIPVDEAIDNEPELTFSDEFITQAIEEFNQQSIEEEKKLEVGVEDINNTLDEVNKQIDEEIQDDPIIKYNVEIINDEPIYQSEQKEMDEANQILEDVQPTVEMFVQEPIQVEDKPLEQVPSEDEDIKKNS